MSFAGFHLRIENLSLRLGGRDVFAPVSLSLKGGDALMLRGANGSGKTSLLRVISGFYRAHTGAVHYESDHLPDQIFHYLGHDNGLKASQTADANLRFWARLSSSGEPIDTRIEQAAQALGVTHFLHLPVHVLSAGQKRRIAATRLLLHRRPVWLLDEPTAGLDAHAAQNLHSICAQHCAAGGVVIAATHHTFLHDLKPQVLDLSAQASVPA